MAQSYRQTQAKTIQAIPHHKYKCSICLWSLGRCCASHWLPRQQEAQHVLPDLHICTEIVGSSSAILQSFFYLNSGESLTVTLRLLDWLIKDSPARGPLLPVAIIAIKGEKTMGRVISSVHKCIYYLSHYVDTMWFSISCPTVWSNTRYFNYVFHGHASKVLFQSQNN